ncbi:MAG: cation acetate symporter [Hyphomicrobium sp.]
MSFSSRTRLINPRLGTYFSIFAALFAALFLLSLIFEQLSISDDLLRMGLFAGPLILYVAIGAAVASKQPLDYFAAGRRVPAGYTGMLLAIIACGGTMLVAGTGAFFLSGFDALVLMMGGLAGFVLMAMLLAPFYRKFGAYTVPSYLGRRFDSRSLRIVAAMVTAVPILLVLSAELHIGAGVAAHLTGYGPGTMMAVLVATVIVIVVPGGKRSFTWAAVAQSVAAILGLAIVAATIATLVTSLPVPQLMYGPLLRNMVRNEVPQGLSVINAASLAFDLPGQGLQHITKPYTQPFGSIGAPAFALGVLMIATGLAAAPWLLPRVAATPSVYDARKSLGWATVLFGIVLLTISSLAVFMRDFVLDFIMTERVGALPQPITDLMNLGFMSLAEGADQGNSIGYDAMSFDRDGIIFATGVAVGLPRSYMYLGMAGALAASLASICATTMALSAILAEDVVQGSNWEPSASPSRVWTARAFVGVAALSGAVLSLLAPTDPLQLVLWALALTSASLFPLLVLSIWWKRLTHNGALAGMLMGFGVAAMAIFMSEAGILGLPSAIAGVLGLPFATIVAMALSSAFPETSRHDLEVVRDIRVPGGEIIYDREMRRLEIKKHARK